MSLIIYPTEPKRIPAFEEVKDSPERLGKYTAHDTHAFKDPDSGLFYVYSTGKGVQLRRSADMIDWEILPPPVLEAPEEVRAYTNSEGIWAPDIHKYGGEYRLYCSYSTFGSQKSMIVLTVSDSPEGPFRYRGVVVKTDGSSPVNAIDANIITDVSDGRIYMSYGSFWGGIRLLELDRETGLSAEEGYGKTIACRNSYYQSSIEGAYIFYNPETEYYYLTVSYGSLTFDYNIRIGRSRSVLGPYSDQHGREMTDMDYSSNEIGFMQAAGYRFLDGDGFRGPGHHSVLQDGENWYAVHHVRPESMRKRYSEMHVRKMVWLDNGWPVCSPEQYAGERECAFAKEDIHGSWERIRFVPLDPQTVTGAVPQTIRENGSSLAGSLSGSWRLLNENTVEFIQGGVRETLRVLPAWDYECWRPTIIMTGMDEKGMAVWYKKREERKK